MAVNGDSKLMVVAKYGLKLCIVCYVFLKDPEVGKQGLPTNLLHAS